MKHTTGIVTVIFVALYIRISRCIFTFHVTVLCKLFVGTYGTEKEFVNRNADVYGNTSNGMIFFPIGSV